MYLLRLLICLCLTFVRSTTIVKILVDGSDEIHYVLIHRGTAKRVSDVATVEFLGYNTAAMETMSSTVLATYKQGAEVTLAPWLGHKLSSDDVIQLALAEIAIFQQPLINEKKLLCQDCKNPGLVILHDHALLVTQHNMFLSLEILNVSTAQNNQCEKTDNLTKTEEASEFWGLPVRNRIDPSRRQIDPTFIFSPMQDPRISLISNDLFLITFAHHHNFPMQAVVKYTGSTLLVTKLYSEIIPDSTFTYGKREKNWVPFMYGDDAYFIRSIDDMHVVSLEEQAPVAQTATNAEKAAAYNVPLVDFPPIVIDGEHYGGYKAMPDRPIARLVASTVSRTPVTGTSMKWNENK
jgi:hypothetical protein